MTMRLADNAELYHAKLGYRGTDKVTGFSGVISSVCYDLYGCVQYLLQPGLDKDGKILDSHWFDTTRVNTFEGSRVMQPVPVRPDAAGPADKPAP